MGDIRTRFTIEGEQQYKSAMTDAANAVKVLNAEQKLAKAQFENTGNAEKYAAQQSDILKRKIDEQKKSVEAARQAMKQLSDNGVAENSRQFQQWQTKLINAQTALTQTETELEKLNGTMQQTSQGTQALVSNLNGISRKISLDQVITGINSITGAMGKAAGKAVELGEVIWNNIMDSAKWADDTATMALMYGIDLDTFQRMQKLVTNGMDTSVDAILTAQSKLNRGIGNGNTNVLKFLKELKIGLREGNLEDPFSWKTKDPAKMFWEVGEALMNMSDAYDKEAAAQALFGRSWRELIPLFTEYKSLDEYNAALAEVNVNSEEDVNALVELYDEVGKLKGNLETLSNEVWAHMAPALTAAADALNGLLTSILEYLETPEGKQALADMATAVSGLFEDLGKIDPEQVVAGFAGVFNGIVEGLQWLANNSDTVISALEAIVIGWGGLKLVGGALEVWKLIQGITGLTGAGAASAAGAAGAAAGTSWGTAFANAVIAAAPWLVGLYTLLNPAETESNDLVDKNGDLTAEGWTDFYNQREWFSRSGEKGYWSQLIEEAGEIVEASANLWDDVEGIKALSKYAQTGNKEQLAAELEALGYVLKTAAETVESVTVDDTGHMYDAAGNNVGYMMPKGEGEVIPYSLYKGNKVMPISPVTWFENGLEFRNVEGEELAELLGGENGAVDVPAEIIIEDGAAQIEEQVGTVPIPVELVVTDMSGMPLETYDVDLDGFHANGLPWVPYDGYLSVLHRGERVLTASENRSYTYNNNNYFGNVNLNNGQDIDALCDRIDRRNRRKQGGFG